MTDFDKKYVDISVKPTKKELKTISEDIIYAKINNVKTIINTVHNIIHQIKYRLENKDESEYSKIINSFQKKLKNFKIEDEKVKNFQRYEII